MTTHNINWGQISSGSEFEALVTQLVYFEDPKARLFRKSGKDGAQDVLSGDGKTVFQAKFHSVPTSGQAISDAKKEFRKIQDYKALDHANQRLWNGITNWCLVSNVAFNAGDRQRWDNEVVPEFDRIGIRAHIWTRSDLEVRLTKHSHVRDSFFEGNTRVFLSVQEALEAIRKEEVFLDYAPDVAFVGRDDEISQMNAFLENNEKSILVIHGAGGIGKTRLMLKFAENKIENASEWQFLWANKATLESSSRWFDGAIGERSTVLLLDEPENASTLKIINEQLFGRLKNWKIFVTVRSPKDPVVEFLDSARVAPKVEKISVGRLPPTVSVPLCKELIQRNDVLSVQSSTWMDDAAGHISQRFDGHPIWMTLAVRALAKHGNLSSIPHDRKTLASEYLREVVALQEDLTKDEIWALLRWIALLGPLNRENDAALQKIVEKTKLGNRTRLLRALSRLVERKVLIKRGANDRLVQIKPDIIRDYILQDWLLDNGRGNLKLWDPTDEAKEITKYIVSALQTKSLDQEERRILTEFARVELQLRWADDEVHLLDLLFEDLRALDPNTLPTVYLSILDALNPIATARPTDAVSISDHIRNINIPSEDVAIFSDTRTYTKKDVLGKLPWFLFHAAIGASNKHQQIAVLEELLLLAEIAPSEDNSSGNSAMAILGRVLQGSRDFWNNDNSYIYELALAKLDALEHNIIDKNKIRAWAGLIDGATALMRQQVSSIGKGITFGPVFIDPSDPEALDRRNRVRLKLRDLAESNATNDQQIMVWNAIAEAHQNANQARLKLKQHNRDASWIERELLDDLIWLRGYFEANPPEYLTLSLAREIWKWSKDFDPAPAIKTVANELEQIYVSTPISNGGVSLEISELEALFDFANYANRDKLFVDKATTLIATGRSDAIRSFFDICLRYFDKNDNRSKEEGNQQLAVFARFIGLAAFDAKRLDLLSEQSFSGKKHLLLCAAGSYIAALRESRADKRQVIAEVQKLFDSFATNLDKKNLLQEVYNYFRGSKSQTCSVEELQLLLDSQDIFDAENSRAEYLGLLTAVWQSSWETVRPKIDQLWVEGDEDSYYRCLREVADSFYWTICIGRRDTEAKEKLVVPADLGKWLVHKIMLAPDLEKLGGLGLSNLATLYKSIGTLPIRKLVECIKARIEKFSNPLKNPSLGYSLGFMACFSTLDGHIADEKDAVDELIQIVFGPTYLGIRTSQLVTAIDPQGKAIPQILSNRIQFITTKRELISAAGIAAAYGAGSNSWRTIALAILHKNETAKITDKQRIYSALANEGLRTYSYNPGEVPKHFVENVTHAQTALENEAEQQLILFWQWQLNLAQIELKQAQEEAKEESEEEL